jgi:hypothetical protein
MEATIDMAVVMGWRERGKHNPAKSEEIAKVLQPICETHTPEQLRGATLAANQQIHGGFARAR